MLVYVDALRPGPYGETVQISEGHVVVFAPEIVGVEDIHALELGVAGELFSFGQTFRARADEGEFETVGLQVCADAEKLFVIGNELRGWQRQIYVAEGYILNHFVRVPLVNHGNILLIQLGVVVVHIYGNFLSDLALHSNLHLLRDLKKAESARPADRGLVVHITLGTVIEGDNLAAGDGKRGS